MPELPEVETIVRNLRQGGEGLLPLPGRQIQAVDLLWERTLAFPSKRDFLSRLTGRRITSVGRRGKYILIGLDDRHLLIHLRMSGDVRIEKCLDETGQPLPPALHDRLILTFENDTCLAFNDTRKFGRIWLVDAPEQILGKLGPEPLEESFTSELLIARLRGRKRQIKPLLLDQAFLAGMGNIYTDEALYLARIHPATLADSLSPEDAFRLWEAIRHVLKEGIQHNGSSIDWVYRGGDFQNYFQVYQRAGQVCPVCGTVILRTVISQRGTYFCPACQPIAGRDG
ncbi:MAG: bifunctional DNA-formamidopyrimidine glycosylase/DNA-(apurinic or apyrimidinic site) lyase [Anaerolineaceae bacterium]|nr:bifunctional DNA-formamidopyrimidine glycosylase/DNA-(apurinic or apyrimidinic site) lyase [Anaerolineaceae bacterium]